MLRPRSAWEEEFAGYVADSGRRHRNTAYLLCGDWHRAEDLTQIAYTKLYLVWRRISRSGSVDAYARRTLVNVYLDEARRPWRREQATGQLPDQIVPAELTEERVMLLAALAGLQPTQRAVVVLRYWEDLSVAETAAVLGIKEGTVKSASARGLTALREVLQGSRTGEPTRNKEEFGDGGERGGDRPTRKAERVGARRADARIHSGLGAGGRPA